MRRPIRNVREWGSDPRSIALLGVALVDARVAITYLPWAGEVRATSNLPDILETIGRTGQVTVSALWFLTTALTAYIGLAQVSVRKPIRWVLALTLAMPVCWGTIYAVSWFLSGRTTLEFSTAILYLALALILGCLILIPPARLYRAHWRTVGGVPPTGTWRAPKPKPDPDPDPDPDPPPMSCEP